MAELKNILYLVAGLILGIGIYWWPLGQFMNECKAIWHLLRNQYSRGKQLNISAGTDLYQVGVASQPLYIAHDKLMEVWHDEGVAWIHSSNGWIRAHVFHVYDLNISNAPVYRACHLYIK